MIEVKTEDYNNHKIATAHHDTKSKDIVIFCHGYRGTAVGPSRFFVRAAQRLEAAGISSIRFDQSGSGNSDGDFADSSFYDWLATTKAIAKNYLDKGYRVALFGQSMGGATVISVASELPEITAVVAWVPDPNIEDFKYPESGYVEEGGQRVQAAYWQEAHDAKIADKLVSLKASAFIVQCSDDEYVDNANQKVILANAQAHHKIVTFENYKHSSWTYDQAEAIIAKSTDFIIESFN